MTIEELCSKFDSSLVVDNGDLLNKVYKSSSDKVFTDGYIGETKVDNNGNIVISELDNATYLAILDSNGLTYLAVYKYISNPSIFEEIYSAYSELKQYKDNLIKSKPKKEEEDTDDNKECIYNFPKDVVDISNFKCPFCKTDPPQVIVNRNPTNNLVDIKCIECDIIFNLIPYKYYKITSYTKPWDA